MDEGLTDKERDTLHNNTSLTKRVWRVVAKDHGMGVDEFLRVPYQIKLRYYNITCVRNPLGG